MHARNTHTYKRTHLHAPRYSHTLVHIESKSECLFIDRRHGLLRHSDYESRDNIVTLSTVGLREWLIVARKSTSAVTVVPVVENLPAARIQMLFQWFFVSCSLHNHQRQRSNTRVVVQVLRLDNSQQIVDITWPSSQSPPLTLFSHFHPSLTVFVCTHVCIFVWCVHVYVCVF